MTTNQYPYPPQQQPMAGYPQQPGNQGPPQGYPQQPAAQYAGAAWPQQQPPAGYPPQPGGYQAGQVPQAQAPRAPQQVPQGLPQLYQADPAVIAAAQQKATAEAARIAAARAGAGAGKGRWWSPAGPQGQEKWDAGVPIGYKSNTLVWVCPPWGAEARGAFFLEDQSHFWKSARSPRGTSCHCPGKETCPICFASKLLYSSGSKDDAARAKYGRQRKQALLQILLLEFPQSHWDPETGKMTPWLFRCSQQVLKGILDVAQTREREGGSPDVTHPSSGCPIWISKTKTGPEPMDVEWGVQRAGDRSLHETFWPALHSLWSLDKFVVPSTQQDMVQAIQEMGLPMTPEVQQLLAAVPTGAPVAGGPPPQGNPYGQPAQQGYAPPPGQTPAQYLLQQVYQGQPQQLGPPPQGQPQGYGPPGVQTPPQGYPGHPQVPPAQYTQALYPPAQGPAQPQGYGAPQQLHQQLRGS
jgi:hypothetical protein